MKAIGKMTQGELAAYVDSHLRGQGLDVILSGGAAVAVYTENRYISHDIDFIPRFGIPQKALAEAMVEIGFSPRGRHFTHPETDFFVEFPAGPLAIGREPIDVFAEVEFPTGVLRILTATDCVKDRLSAYFHWGDRQALEQAVLVAAHNKIDVGEIERWAGVEGASEAFLEIKERL